VQHLQQQQRAREQLLEQKKQDQQVLQERKGQHGKTQLEGKPARKSNP
jgi:hypothetical protein